MVEGLVWRSGSMAISGGHTACRELGKASFYILCFFGCPGILKGSFTINRNVRLIKSKTLGKKVRFSFDFSVLFLYNRVHLK